MEAEDRCQAQVETGIVVLLAKVRDFDNTNLSDDDSISKTLLMRWCIKETQH